MPAALGVALAAVGGAVAGHRLGVASGAGLVVPSALALMAVRWSARRRAGLCAPAGRVPREGSRVLTAMVLVAAVAALRADAEWRKIGRAHV